MDSVDLYHDDVSRLITDYPAAVTDCLGLPTSPLTVYKTGSLWPVTGSEYPYKRELRPVYDTQLAEHWDNNICNYVKCLDELDFQLAAMDVVGFANEGEVHPFCKALLWVGVLPRTLTCEAAKVGAKAVKCMLSEAGFPDLEVAFRETESYFGSRRHGLLPLKEEVHRPVLEELRKPFTPTPSVAIARYDSPQCNGTGGLYYRLGDSNDAPVLLLTASHVVRPLSDGDGSSQEKREVIILGDQDFTEAKNAIPVKIRSLEFSVMSSKRTLSRLPERVEGEERGITAQRQLHEALVASSKHDIQSLHNLYKDVTTHWTDPAERTIGFVQHAEPVTVSDDQHKYTRDFALINVYKDMIDWSKFLGNKVYFGDNLCPEDLGSLLYPRHKDNAFIEGIYDGLLQMSDVVQEGELRKPQHLDVTGNGEMCTFVLKSGLATGTTVGRANGLKSFVRRIDDSNVVHSSIEVAILPYSSRRTFSDRGDSGAIILDRSGRIVALLNGGAGGEGNPGADMTYGTPYWWVEKEIQKVYPDCQRYPAVNM